MLFRKLANSYLIFCIFTLTLIIPFADFLRLQEDALFKIGGLQIGLNSRRPVKKRHHMKHIKTNILNFNQNVDYNANLHPKDLDDDSENHTKLKYKSRKGKARRSIERIGRKTDELRITVHTNNEIEDFDVLFKNIRVSVMLRTNLIRALGYLLQVVGATSNLLTEEQYSALHLVYTALRERRVYFFSLLPFYKDIMQKEVPNGNNKVMEEVLKLISENLPKYLKCAANFLADEFHNKAIDIDKIINMLHPPEKTFKIFKGVTPEYVKIIYTKDQNSRLHVKPVDDDDKVINKALGPAFINIINQMYAKNNTLSQNIFVGILGNMPINAKDPVLEESIAFVYNLGKHNKIPDWEKLGAIVNIKNPYAFIKYIIAKLVKIQAEHNRAMYPLIYIGNHLKPILPTYVSPQIVNMNDFNADTKKTIIQLLQAIAYPEFNNYTIKARDFLINKIVKSLVDLSPASSIINNYKYDNPHDLLLGVLTKLQALLKAEANYTTVANAIAKIIASMLLKMSASRFASPPFADIYINDILPTVQDTMSDADFNNTLKTILENEKWLDNNLPQIIWRYKKKCVHSKTCLPFFLHHLPDDIRVVLNPTNISIIPDISVPTEQTTTVKSPIHPPAIQTSTVKYPIHPPAIHTTTVKSPIHPPAIQTSTVKYPIHPPATHTTTVKSPPDIVLPTIPNTPKSYKRIILQLLRDQKDVDLVTIVQEDLTISPKDLERVLMLLIEKHSKLINEHNVDAINFYLEQIIPKMILFQQGSLVRRIKFDLLSVLKEVIDYKNFSARDKINFVIALKYLNRHPELVTKNHDIDLFKYSTKGEIIKYVLEEIIKKEPDPTEKAKLQRVLNKVQLTGPGADKLLINKMKTAIDDRK